MRGVRHPISFALSVAVAVATIADNRPLPAAEPSSGDTSQQAFVADILPILEEHCQSCHGGGPKSKAGLDLTSQATLLKGAASGPVLLPGRAAESLLIQSIRSGGKPHMPPQGQLSDADIAAITRWVNSLPAQPLGRPVTDQDRRHWAFQPPVRHPPPTVNNEAWVRNPLDAFVLARLEQEGLAPAPPASRAEWIRRAYFDLIGLPPTPAEVQAFLDDPSEQACETIVDRLLASPHYGERWGRHWLDLARYADSGGFHDDIHRPNAWRYRDYVIDSFNADKPYPRFIAEQLAGDELAPGEAAALIATGFCRNGPSNEGNMGMGQDLEKYRLDELDDVISTTSTVFLGLTLGCARCHDHKYDPISQADYYALLAVFNNTAKQNVPLSPDGQVRPEPVPGPAGEAPPPDRKKAVDVSAAMALVESSAPLRSTRLLWRGDLNNPGPLVEPAVPAVLATTPVPFSASTGPLGTTGRRLQLARWIGSPDNPLTYRVLANRIWQQHFGRGLVATPGNFGVNGAPPSHPELLDHLALEIIAHGGRIKFLHKQILLSSTYRQSSRLDADVLRVDPENSLIARRSKRRIEAEVIRDSVLAVSGKLNPQPGGPGIKPRIRADLLTASQRNKWPVVTREGPAEWRRSVYIYVKRQLLMPMMELFDAPTTTSTCDRRAESVLPTQALIMMNDEFIEEQAGYFAERVLAEAGSVARDQAERALWLALSRPPSNSRLDDAVAFLAAQQESHQAAGRNEADARRQALRDLCHVLLNCNEFVYVD